MECFVLLLFLLAWGFLQGWLSDVFSGSSGSSGSDVLYRNNSTPIVNRSEMGELTLRLRPDHFDLEDGSDPMPMLRVLLSGNIEASRRQEPVKFVVRVVDETDGEDNRMPVFCIIPQFRDEEGVFQFEQEMELPYAITAFDNLDLVRLPTFAFAGPRSGRRRIRVLVLVVSQHNSETYFGAGSASTTITLDLPGYMELAEQSAHRELQIAQLAISLAAADGRIDRRETTAIRRFFTERNMDIQDEAQRRDRVETLMRDAMAPFREKGKTRLRALMTDICAQLVEDDDAVRQVAYELAVQVVASDDEVDDREYEALRFVARKLDLPEGFIKEAHDRNLRANMFGEADAEKLLGVPEGLSTAEKKRFLSKEYKKWRARVTHNDPKVAAEASIRLKQIARARAALGDG